MMSDRMIKVESLTVKDINGKEHRMGDLLSNDTTVVFFLRRFGCLFCRWTASKVSQLSDQLKMKGINMIAIGPELLGMKEFIDGKFWQGEVFYDEKHELYEKLGLGKMSWKELISIPFRSIIHKMKADAEKDGIRGNYRGDYRQLGGLFVVGKDGKIIYEFIQKDVTAEPNVNELADTLGVDSSRLKGISSPPPQCTTECSISR